MIALSGATAGIAASGALLAVRSRHAAPRARLAAVFALFAGVAALPLVIAFARGLYVFYLPLVLPMFLALSPAIYLYVDARTSVEAPAAPDWRHGILPFVGAMIAIGYWSLPGGARATMFVDGEMPEGLAPRILGALTFALIGVWSIVSFGYLLAILRRLRRFRGRLKDLYSNTESRELRWIDWLMGFLAFLWAASATTLISDNFGPGLLFSGEWIQAIATAMLLFLVAFSLTPAPAAEEAVEDPAPALAEAPNSKYQRSSLTPELASELAARIERAMRDDALYLDPNLSLQKLAAHVRGAPNLVSQTLNERLQKTFFDYIAHWRIAAAKERLRTSDASVLAVALDVGFNSRSTFYEAFKRETGLTPTAFRDQSKAPPT